MCNAECYLLHPNLVADLPSGANFTKRLLNQRVSETLVNAVEDDEDLSLVIRTLNEARNLEKIFEDLHQQIFTKEVEVIVVDNESTDGTTDVARHYGAEVVTLKRPDFTYPRSMNLGVEAASHNIVMLTVGHVRLSNTYNLHAGARHFADPTIAGVFGSVLPNENASVVEKLSAIGRGMRMKQPAHEVSKVGRGVLGATNAMIAKAAWKELGGFDEKYEIGGEDTALAKQMLDGGYGLIEEPALAIHHSHGLGFVDFLQQIRAELRMLNGPQRLDREKLYARRPDLRANIFHESVD